MMRLKALPFACLGLAFCGACNEADWKWDQGGGGSRSGGGVQHREGEEEVWTIQCSCYKDADHQRFADELASALKRVRDIRPNDVWVQHEDTQSCIYYGTYKLKYVRARTNDSKKGDVKGDVIVDFSPQIKSDYDYIKSLAWGERHPFFGAVKMAKPTENVGPPEWDLRNAMGVYTLHVGVTYNTPTLHDYKQAAVEWVKVLREQNFEAYYYHDPESARSDICVGTFGEDARVEVSKGHHRYSDKVVQLQLQSDFRWNLENGHKVSTVRPDKGRITNQSFLVEMPKDQKSLRDVR